MQCFHVVHCGITHKSLVFSWFIHKPLGECVYQEDTSGYFNHAIENKVAGKANIIKAQTTVERNWQECQYRMGRLGVVPLPYCTDHWEGS